MTFNHWEPNLSWNALNLFTSVGWGVKSSLQFRCQKLAPSNFFGFHFPEPFQFFQDQTTVQAHHHRFHPHAQKKNSLKAPFAPTGEAKKAGKASRRAEETPKPPLATGKTACKNWLSSIFTLVTLHSDFLRNLS